MNFMEKHHNAGTTQNNDEAALVMMHERPKNGQSPEHFAIA